MAGSLIYGTKIDLWETIHKNSSKLKTVAMETLKCLIADFMDFKAIFRSEGMISHYPIPPKVQWECFTMCHNVFAISSNTYVNGVSIVTVKKWFHCVKFGKK